MKNFIKSICFLTIFCYLFFVTFSFLWLRKTPVAFFFEEPKNTIDTVYIGSSNVFTSYNPTLAFNEYGISVGNLSANSQSLELAKYLIMETENYQNPKLYIIDITQIATDFEDYTESNYRNTIDSMPFSKTRFMAIDDILKRNGKYNDSNLRLNYYFSFFVYHDRWKDLIDGFSRKSKSLYKGYFLTNRTTKNIECYNFIWKNNEEKLPKKNEEVLKSLINYIKNEDLNVLFIIPPRTFTDIQIGRLNSSTKIILNSNMNIINFNKLDDFKIDYNKDLYNETHINVYGATKYTLYFSKYLSEHYDLGYHKNENKYKSWDSEYERFKATFNKLTGENFNEVLENYKMLGY